LISDPRLGNLLKVVRELPQGTGILLRHHHLPAAERRLLLRKVRRVVVAKRLVVIDEAKGEVARVHDLGELRRAKLSGARLIFLSPLFPTRSHPEWSPLSHMRAAALARMGERTLLALGGMDPRRFRQVRRLGFVGWGGIDGWHTPGSSTLLLDDSYAVAKSRSAAQFRT
jgi:thiamine-phosphate pyrophosphorylase